jgi:hypothetical protein
MANELLRKALAEQEQRLQELDAKIAALTPLARERDSVHTLVSQMRFTLGLGPYLADKIPPPEVSESTPASSGPIAQPSQPIWMVARTVIEQAGHPLSPGEIAEMLYGLGFKTLVGRPGRETVRALLNKKKGLFQKLEGGRFAVRKTLI